MATKILIADDAQDLLDNMRESLEMEGYDVIATKDGAEALTELQKGDPDLIITDLMMARLDGFELIRRVRENGAWNHIPILVYSALPAPENSAIVLKLGAISYVNKPCSIDAFLEAVLKSL